MTVLFLQQRFTTTNLFPQLRPELDLSSRPFERRGCRNGFPNVLRPPTHFILRPRQRETPADVLPVFSNVSSLLNAAHRTDHLSPARHVINTSFHSRGVLYG
jgi:hypothetical protein